MPSTSDRQRGFFGIVMAYKKGTLNGKPGKAVKKAAGEMSEGQVKDFLVKKSSTDPVMLSIVRLMLQGR